MAVVEVKAIGRAGHHGDGAPTGVQGAVVGDPFETLVDAAYDGDPGTGEVAGELERPLPGVAGVLATAGDRDRQLAQQLCQAPDRAARVQNGGR
jgi:hypothetical protein